VSVSRTVKVALRLQFQESYASIKIIKAVYQVSTSLK